MHKHPVYCEGAVEVPFAGTSVGVGAENGSSAAGCGCGAGDGAVGSGTGYGTGSGVRCFEGPKMVAYVNGVSESVFKVGMCLPAGPYVSDSDVAYIIESIKEAIK